MKQISAPSMPDDLRVSVLLPQYKINARLTTITLEQDKAVVVVSLHDLPALIETLQDLENQANEYLKTLDS